MGEFTCPLCDKQLENYMCVQNDDSCCDNKELINDNGKNVYKNCGKVYGYDIASEFIDFYENMNKIKRKSVYHRKYHTENILN